MPNRVFALESDGPPRLKIKWTGGRLYPQRDIQVLLDGKLLATLDDRAALERGQTYALPDGATLAVKMQELTWNVVYNGQDLSELAHPQQALQVYQILFLIKGVVNLLLAGIGLLRPLDVGMPPAALITTGVCGLGYLAMAGLLKQGFAWGTVVGAALYAAEGLLVQIQAQEFSATKSFKVLLGILGVWIGWRILKLVKE